MVMELSSKQVIPVAETAAEVRHGTMQGAKQQHR